MIFTRYEDMITSVFSELYGQTANAVGVRAHTVAKCVQVQRGTYPSLKLIKS